VAGGAGTVVPVPGGEGSTVVVVEDDATGAGVGFGSSALGVEPHAIRRTKTAARFIRASSLPHMRAR
jgi:hypothetical protein